MLTMFVASNSLAQRSASKTAKLELPSALANIPTLKRVVARNNQLTSLPEGMENLTELKTIDVKGNPFDDGTKVQTIRRFGEDVKIKID